MKAICRPAYILMIALLMVISSCSVRQRIVLPVGFKGPNELSRLYGVHLTPADNIFLYNEGAKWLGTPHRTGGNTQKGVDCSGFAAIIYREIYGKQLARTAAGMLANNCRSVKRPALREGDLVFFNTSGGGGNKKNAPNHVGIYLKDGRFIHASTSRGVMVSSLTEPYYVHAWLTGGRVD